VASALKQVQIALEMVALVQILADYHLQELIDHQLELVARLEQKLALLAPRSLADL
jgi:hypothetical protein